MAEQAVAHFAGRRFWVHVMNEEHPPLAKVLAAAPLVVRGVHADYSQASWTFSGNGMFKQILCEWVFGHWLITRWNVQRTD